MSSFSALLSAMPKPPDYRYDWAALSQSVLSRFFEGMARTQQHPAFHGEGDVWAHTQMVCDALAGMPAFRALPERQRQEAALAALLHDIGKIRTTKLEDGQWTSPGHSSAGAHMAREVLWAEYGLCGTKEKQTFRETVCLLIRWHMSPGHILDQENPERTLIRLAAQGQLCPDFTMHLLCMLALADAQGRTAPDVPELCERVELCIEAAREAGCLHQPAPFASAVTQHAYLDGRSVWAQQELYDESWGEMILLCGLPGTGKDTWIRTHHPEMPVVSLDDIRRSMGIAPTDNQGPVAQAAMEQARVHLRAHQPFIWNATSLTSLTRQKALHLAEQYGARTRIIYLEAGWEENLRRNRERRYTVPEHIIARMLGSLIPPERHEAQSVDWQCI